jgi:hypothetical protein
MYVGGEQSSERSNTNPRQITFQTGVSGNRRTRNVLRDLLTCMWFTYHHAKGQ